MREETRRGRERERLNVGPFRVPPGWLKKHKSHRKVIELVDGVVGDAQIAVYFGWVGWEEP